MITFAFCLPLLTAVSATPRVTSVVPGQELIDSVSPPGFFADKLKQSNSNFGSLDLLGSCCGESKGQAFQVAQSVNTNNIYGSTIDVAKGIFDKTNCSHVDSQSLDATVSVDCNYFFVFKNKAHAEHDYAANCVPAAVCKDDVVGMTKGLVGTYGVVLQILQGNLGSLYWLGEGQLNECYKAMHQINTGKIEDLFVTKPGLVIAGHVLTHDTVMEIPGMTKLGVKESLSSCKDDGSVGYLFVHKNLYWSNKKDEVDLGEFTKFKQEKEKQKLEAAKKKAEAAAREAEAQKKKEADEKAAAEAAASEKALKIQPMDPSQERQVTLATAPALMAEVVKEQADDAKEAEAEVKGGTAAAKPVPAVPPVAPASAVAAAPLPPALPAVPTPAQKPSSLSALALAQQAEQQVGGLGEVSKSMAGSDKAEKVSSASETFQQQVDKAVQASAAAKKAATGAAKAGVEKVAAASEKDAKTVSAIASRRLSGDIIV